MAMHYAYDPVVWTMEPQLQYLFGSEFLVAPCMFQGGQNVSVYFPALSGPWIHLVRGWMMCVSLFLHLLSNFFSTFPSSGVGVR